MVCSQWRGVDFSKLTVCVFFRWGYVRTPDYSWRTVLRTSWIFYPTLTSTWGWFCVNTRKTRDLLSLVRMTISKCTSTAWWRNPKEQFASLRKPRRECTKNSHRTGRMLFVSLVVWSRMIWSVFCKYVLFLSIVKWNERDDFTFVLCAFCVEMSVSIPADASPSSVIMDVSLITRIVFLSDTDLLPFERPARWT